MRRNLSVKLMTMLTIVAIIALSLAACALWKEKATVTYEGVGDILTQTYTNVKQLCDSGTLKAEDCVKIKDTYNKARKAYIVAGDTLIATMNLEASIKSTQDAVAKKNLQAQLQTLMAQYNQNIQDAGKLASEFENLYYDLGGK
jgi:hypothetical protein